jgi:chromosome segregation ATPase
MDNSQNPISINILNEQKIDLEKEIKQLLTEEKILRRKIKNKQKELTNIISNIKKLNAEINLSKILRDYNLHIIPNIHLVNNDELNIIINDIDKNDYTASGKDRIMDLRNVIDEIIKTKIKYDNCSLITFKKTFKIDTYPPKNIYRYEYRLDDGLILIKPGVEITML